MSICKIRTEAKKKGFILRYDRKLRAWCLVDLNHNALIGQFDSPEEEGAWLDG